MPTRKSGKQNRRKSRKSRRRRFVGGGKLTLLPFTGTPALGEPLDDKKMGAFLYNMLNEWDYYMVAAHGHSKPTSYKDVPERTYLIFNAPSGCGAVGPMIPYNEILVNDNRALFALSLCNAQARAIQRQHAVSKGLEIPGGDVDFLLRTLAPSERLALKACVYPTEFYAPAFKRSTPALCELGPSFIGKTIYGPGEKYPNTMVAFKNDPAYTVWLGTYALPVPQTLYETTQRRTSLVRGQYEARVAAGVAKPEMKGEFFKSMDKILFNIPENLTKDLIGQYVPLSDVLSALPALPAGKSRFVFVTVCRNVVPAPGKDFSNAEALRIAGLMRQASVAENNAEIADLQKATTEAATAYYGAPAGSAGSGDATGGAGTA